MWAWLRCGLRFIDPLMSSRDSNERKFGNWRESPDGSRIYWKEVAGRGGWRAIYLKEVSPGERTLRFWQEVYDGHGKLRGLHEKYPVDTGHKSL